MDFTPEQQAAIDVEVARQVASAQAGQQMQAAILAQQHANSIEMQTAQATAQAALQAAQAASNLEIQAKQAKLAAVQLAQSTLIANRNNQPVDAREISPADITTYADSLVAYVNG
jgi:hypothetical protein